MNTSLLECLYIFQAKNSKKFVDISCDYSERDSFFLQPSCPAFLCQPFLCSVWTRPKVGNNSTRRFAGGNKNRRQQILGKIVGKSISPRKLRGKIPHALFDVFCAWCLWGKRTGAPNFPQIFRCVQWLKWLLPLELHHSWVVWIIHHQWHLLKGKPCRTASLCYPQVKKANNQLDLLVLSTYHCKDTPTNESRLRGIWSPVSWNSRIGGCCIMLWPADWDSQTR